MKQNKLSRIVDAAFDEWAKTRFTNTSLNLISGRLSISKQALYRYFPNKAAIFEAMGHRLLSDLTEMTRTMEEGASQRHTASADGPVADYVRALEAFLSANPNYHVFLTMYVFRQEGPLQREIHLAMIRQSDVLRAQLEPYCPTGIDRESWENTLSQITVSALLLCALRYWDMDGSRRRESAESLHAFTRRVVSALTDGLLPGLDTVMDPATLLERFRILPSEMPPADRILTAVETTVAVHGVELASLDRIAAAAGIAKSTLYSHFTNKDDMFERMVLREQSAFAALYRRKAQGVGSPGDRVCGYMITLASYLIQNTALLSVFEWLRSQRFTVRLGDPRRFQFEEPLSFLCREMEGSAALGRGFDCGEVEALVSAFVFWRIYSAKLVRRRACTLDSIYGLFRMLVGGLSGVGDRPAESASTVKGVVLE